MGKAMISEHKSQTYNSCFVSINGIISLSKLIKKKKNTKQTKYHILQFYYHTSVET